MDFMFFCLVFAMPLCASDCIAPLATEGAMCTFHTFEKTRLKMCSLLKNQVCNINVWC